MARDTLLVMTRRALALVAVAASLAGCSADAVDEPEPELETPGAFVAVDDGAGAYEILRTLTSLEVGNDRDVIFFTLFAPTAVDFEQARELARDPALPIQDELVLLPEDYVLSRSWKVVWFRTLTEEERDILR
jgi:hypothetical protein